MVAVEHGDIEAQGEKWAGWMGTGMKYSRHPLSVHLFLTKGHIFINYITYLTYLRSSHLTPPSWFSVPTPVCVPFFGSLSLTLLSFCPSPYLGFSVSSGPLSRGHFISLSLSLSAYLCL